MPSAQKKDRDSNTFKMSSSEKADSVKVSSEMNHERLPYEHISDKGKANKRKCSVIKDDIYQSRSKNRKLPLQE